MRLRWKIVLQQNNEKKDKFIMQQLETAHFFLIFFLILLSKKTGKLLRILHHDNLYLSVFPVTEVSNYYHVPL
jgi:hypothetical protein